jgi:glycogen phosphorylase
MSVIEADEDLKRVMNLLESGYFNQYEPGLFEPIVHAVRSAYDPWMTAADFASYVRAQQQAATAYRDQDHWTRMSILNTAASGQFSTDRTIGEYNRDIWKLRPIPALTPA